MDTREVIIAINEMCSTAVKCKRMVENQRGRISEGMKSEGFKQMYLPLRDLEMQPSFNQGEYRKEILRSMKAWIFFFYP